MFFSSSSAVYFFQFYFGEVCERPCQSWFSMLLLFMLHVAKSKAIYLAKSKRTCIDLLHTCKRLRTLKPEQGSESIKFQMWKGWSTALNCSTARVVVLLLLLLLMQHQLQHRHKHHSTFTYRDCRGAPRYVCRFFLFVSLFFSPFVKFNVNFHSKSSSNGNDYTQTTSSHNQLIVAFVSHRCEYSSCIERDCGICEK